MSPRLRPSAAERWIACPGSVRLSEGLTENDESWFAAEGTHAHLLASLRLTDASSEELAEWEENGEGFDVEEIAEYVDQYIAFLDEHSTPTTTRWIETLVTTGVDDCAGTADAILIDEPRLHVVDLKYGKGIRVDARDNPQLRLYALGALRAVELLGEFESITMTIFQPRLNHVSSVTLSVAELLQWRDEVAIPAAEATYAAEPALNPGEVQCRWCPAAGICKPRAELMLARERFLETNILTAEELADAVDELADVRAWCDQIEKEALERASRNQLPGYKVVLSGGRRSITDGAAAIEALVAAGYAREDVQRVQPETLTRLERLVGKTTLPDILGPLLVKSQGTQSLASEDDPRPAWSSAAEDFA